MLYRFVKRSWSLVAVGVLVALTSSVGVQAAPKDGQARQAIAKALEDDYLQTDFDGAESRLTAALDSCDFEFSRIDLVTGNFQSVGGCDNGIHEMSSEGPFGLTVWGWGSAASGGFSTQAVSYAYPAGASIQPINTITVPATPN